MPTATVPAVATLGELLARDSWPRERVLAHQQARLRALLEHAVTRSPYYRRSLGPNAPDAPLSELPTLSKATVMEYFDEIVCDPRLHLADLRAHMAAGEAALMLGSSTPQDPCMELSEDLLVIEVVDEHDRPVPAGVPGAKVLVTNLVNYAQPLIRYQLSDVVTPADAPGVAGPNPSGRPWRRIASIEGRCMDALYLPGQRGGQVAVHPTALGPVFASPPDVCQYQVVYDLRSLRARVVPADGAATDLPERLCRALATAVAAAGAVPPAIAVEQVAALQREPGPAAKFKLVKSTVPAGRPIPPG